MPVGLIDSHSVVSNLAFVLYYVPLWNMALIASRLYLAWTGTVCGKKLKANFRYSNRIGWNTFNHHSRAMPGAWAEIRNGHANDVDCD